MKQLNRCVAVLLFAVLLLTGLASVGTSQARFVNAVSWHGVYIPETVTVKSDRLSEGGQTVMLADWYLDDETSREYTISLKAEEGTAQGNMFCQTPDGNLIRVSVDTDGVVVDQSESIVVLSVELKKAALSLKKETTVSVVVSWTDIDRGTVLWADFNCTLIPTEQEETEPATEEPTEKTEVPTEKETEVPVEDVTETPTEEETGTPAEEGTVSPTEKATEAPIEETEAPTKEATEAPTKEATEAPTKEATEATSEESTETQETETISNGQGNETEQAITEKTEETSADVKAEEQPQGMVLSVADEIEEVGEPVETEPTQAPSEASEPTEAPSETGATEESFETDESTQASSETGMPTEEPAETEKPTEAPVETSVPTETQKKPIIPDIPVEIIQYTENIAWTEWFGIQIAVPDGVAYLEVYCNGSAFPEGTRFILNESQEILPENAQTFIIPVNGKSVQLLLINMADVYEEDQQDVMEIMVTANGADGTEYSLDSVQVNATRKPLEFPAETDYAVLSSTASMNIACEWDATDVICKVERLIRNDDGGGSWQEGEYGLTVQIHQVYDPEKEQIFSVSNESGTAPAGCYRITVRREFEGMVISEKRILFFIHY